MSKLLVDEISDADNTGPVTVTDGLNVSSGNVGIGTSSPEKPLHVKGASATYVRIESTSASQNAMLDIKSTVATWSIGQNAVKTDGSFEFYNGSSTPIFFTTSGAVTVGADLTLTNGNLVVGTAGKGIDFSATAGTGTSELLDDYEEGSGTPVVGASVSGTVTIAAGSRSEYTKIGNQVHFQFEFQVTATGSGAIKVTLPFTAYGYAAGSLRTYNVTFSGTSPFIETVPSHGVCYFYSNSSGNTTQAIMSTGYYYGEITYTTSA